VVQTVVIVLLALVLGADYGGGVGGVALLGASFASLSNGVAVLAVLAGQRADADRGGHVVQLPLTFLSAALMQQSLTPGWIRTVARFNPVNWAMQAGRSAAMQKIDWSLVATRIGLLAALALLCGAFATWVFGKYQRSL
jgi:ABC-2 type transport system permease protein